ncbi:MAG: META domain-containing protein [Carboxylicivirga sp.]|jgi:heat shock protein HslJ|nr:META domain-containing protein [Carboxylicivirga sp.]
MKKLFIGIIALGFMISCKSAQNTSSAQKNTQKTAEEQFVEGNIWQLTKFKGQSLADAGFSQKTPQLIINMAENKTGGNGGCNSFGGEVKVEGKTMAFDKIFSTKMYCDGVPENEFFQILQQPLEFQLDNDLLRLSKDGKVLMEFKLMDKEKVSGSD